MQTWVGSNINLDNLIDDEVEGKLALAVESIMQSQIIGTWTAIETLMGDLWVKTLNLKPELGIRAMGAEISPDDTDHVKDQKEKIRREYPIPSWMARQPGFDLDKSMGTLLRDKWKFSKRNEAEEAYLKAFGRTERESLKAILRSDDIQWIAATRNALVHNAGRADAEFVASVKRHPVLNQVKEGEEIPLNGELVGSLIGNANKRAVELVMFVSKWLEKH